MRRTRIAAALLILSASLFAQRQQIQRQGGDWSELETGSLPAAGVHRLKVNSMGTVVANGSGGSLIEYKLTRLGDTLGEAVCGIWLWVEKNVGAVERAREAYARVNGRRP